MKIAINTCFGGFSLSDKAIEMVMKRKGLECFRYKQSKYSFKDGKNEYKKCTASDIQDDSGLFLYYHTTDLGDVVEGLPNESHWYYGNLERTDEDLIAVIEELGSDADGRFGDLKIVDIPDGVDWEIDEYDGVETIHEVHRSWC